MTVAASTAVLVAGMHRSGTSATTGALAHFGVALGDKLLEPADDNPKGYWENERAVSIHETLLHALGRHWADVRALPSGWRGSDPARRAADAIRALIDEQFADATLWAIKDPRICRVLPLWLDVLNERGVRPTVLIVARRPSEVAASIAARNGWSPALGRLLWLRHMLDATTASAGVERTAITYERLLADPRAAIGTALRRLAIAIDAPADESGLGEFVDRSIRHFDHASMATPERDRLAAMANDAYDAFSVIAAGADDWSGLRPVDERFDAWNAEWGEYADALAETATMCESRLRETHEKVHALRSALGAQIAWSEDAVKTHSDVLIERDDLAARLKIQEAHANALDAIAAEREQTIAETIAQASQRAEAMQARFDSEAEARRQLEMEVSRLRDAQRSSELDAERLRAAHRSSEIEAERLREAKARAEREIEALEDAKRHLEAALAEERDRSAADRETQSRRIEVLEASIRELTSTLSWRITRPLRAIRRFLPRAAERGRGDA
ncbi:MAG: hypothetical protein E6Q50_03890 [Lysobacter sp.]|nr:MAG: hypothetical protein E6Q50_03890 [Lysobacter sp.]